MTVQEWVAASHVVVQRSGDGFVATLLLAGHQINGPTRPNRTYALLGLAGIFDSWVDEEIGTESDREFYVALAELVRSRNPVRAA